MCHRTTCDTVAGTAWDTVPTNNNICRWQQQPPQAFAVNVPAKMNSSQLRRHVGGSSRTLEKENVLCEQSQRSSAMYECKV